ncbi:MAG: helix-turn-helix domain-containing protein [gamma proteobacterium symbiont of Bathyaustriella thionipta]|nr:helix-turn-helix domain-containing protein [gamma proteobacterium symbiont of Bathyaustriella thionipta]MCU7966981.1 helix-turn-helix domain-containing protein [gamma proteobacterium symbiont of Bathyaustriella thionipta]
MTKIHFFTGLVDMSVFSERLKLLRASRNITQARLAGLLEVDPRVYNRWERGLATPQFDTIIKIANILQVSIDELAGRKEAEDSSKIHNHELSNLYQQVDNLPDEDQKALILVIDSFIKKAQMLKVVGTH